MKRYKAINFEYDDAYGTDTALDIVEHDEGEFVKYDDIKHLLQNTSSNSDYAKLSKRLQSGRDYLMAVSPEEISVEKCLIAFGWDSNGFE